MHSLSKENIRAGKVSSELGELGVAGGLAFELLVEVLGIVPAREGIQKGDRWHTLHRSLGYDRW